MKTTVMDELKSTSENFGTRPALRSKTDGSWTAITWGEYYGQIKMAARALITLGLEQGRGVSILGNNSPQWFISDLAAIFAGAVPGGIYTTNSPEQCRYIAEHSEAAVIVVENSEQLGKINAIRHELPQLKAVVLMNGSAGDAYSWKDLPGLAEKTPESVLHERMGSQTPDDCCTLIYTSGTTGNPKGVMLSHDNITWVARTVNKTISGSTGDHLISYLPLSHIAEQIVSLHCPSCMGCTVSFAESMDKLGENLTEVRPTLFLAVPRVWEKIQEKMTAAGASNPLIKKKIAAWARKKGMAGGYANQKGDPRPFLFDLADKLVFSKVREKLGLDRCRVFISTAAPISMDTLEFFLSLGIPITEVYGMSECTGPSTLSIPEPFKFRTGWAGPPLPGTEVAIAEDGEVLIRGRHVFKGYYKNDAATQETIDEKGWLHSGDVGKIGDDGFLKITDRKKELIITSGGENIPPQIIEGKLKAVPVISQAVVFGDGRKYLTALFTLDPEKIRKEARAADSPATDAETASQCSLFRSYLQGHIDTINSTLPRPQTVKNFVILPREFTIEGDELTPTMKLKRRIIHTKYKKEIESMY
ncbi:MAG: AMP-binding protein [Pseudomonadota bacterium]